MKKQLIRILLAFMLFIIIFTVDKIINLSSLFSGQLKILVPFVLYLIVYLLVGYDVLWKAVRNIFHGQLMDENFLMITATFGAFGLAIYRGINGQSLDGFDEACAVLLFYQLGEWLQKYATQKSRNSIMHLMDLRPDYANLVINRKVSKIDPSDVAIGSIIIVNPGEKIPLDGIVVKGSSSLDMKSLTGESLPRTVMVNDEVLSGSVNLTTQITIKVTKTFYDSTATKILDLVENAAMKKSKSENFITKFARYYTPIVILAAIVLAVTTGIITTNWGTSLYRALSFLVVSCPCALVISIPMSFFVAIGFASKIGILIKGSTYLDKLNHARTFVFDKTGTLTKGNFTIKSVEPQTKREQILSLAAIAEKNSNHPIARAIIAAYGKKVKEGYTLTNISGAGVIAVKDNEKIYCGNAKLLQDNKINFKSVSDSGSVVYVAYNQTYMGCILIQDEPRSEAHDVLTALSDLSIQSVMLTGDNENVARQVANNLGITSYRAELLPQNKVNEVEKLLTEKQKDVICFIGDGTNDAPVLMRADIGITMGGIGSDAAIEAADIILMYDDLYGLLTVKKLARRTMWIVRQNIIFSILIKFGILVLSALGIANMWMAIFGDVGVAMLTILNAFRVKLLTNTHKNSLLKKRVK